MCGTDEFLVRQGLACIVYVIVEKILRLGQAVVQGLHHTAQAISLIRLQLGIVLKFDDLIVVDIVGACVIGVAG